MRFVRIQGIWKLRRVDGIFANNTFEWKRYICHETPFSILHLEKIEVESKTVTIYGVWFLVKPLYLNFNYSPPLWDVIKRLSKSNKRRTLSFTLAYIFIGKRFYRSRVYSCELLYCVCIEKQSNLLRVTNSNPVSSSITFFICALNGTLQPSTAATNHPGEV